MQDLIKQRDKALYQARRSAKLGHYYMTQQWLNRAAQFWPASPRQIANLQKMCDSVPKIGRSY